MIASDFERLVVVVVVVVDVDDAVNSSLMFLNCCFR
jgi:hypothetical protein